MSESSEVVDGGTSASAATAPDASTCASPVEDVGGGTAPEGSTQGALI